MLIKITMENMSKMRINIIVICKFKFATSKM
jgi:hypothetical protein